MTRNLRMLMLKRRRMLLLTGNNSVIIAWLIKIIKSGCTIWGSLQRSNSRTKIKLLTMIMTLIWRISCTDTQKSLIYKWIK